ncbi:MAG: DUF1365 domain-containing protein [Cypionkella sp.]
MTAAFAPQHLRGQTYHGRKGPITNEFRYGGDYVLLDPASPARGPRLFSRNRANLTSVHDSDHGGPPKAGLGLAWARRVLAAHGAAVDGQILLLTQPRVLGHVFNPVSFWLCHDASGALRVVIAEVSNTFGDRHSYLCLREDGGVITQGDVITAQKIFHVSPFQPIAGGYTFRFDISAQKIGVWIDFNASAEYGLIATLTGRLAPLTNWGILKAALRRPFGSRRVVALIHWQALKLFFKGARYHPHSPPPRDEVSK